jgi:hypothetical protein
LPSSRYEDGLKKELKRLNADAPMKIALKKSRETVGHSMAITTIAIAVIFVIM